MLLFKYVVELKMIGLRNIHTGGSSQLKTLQTKLKCN